MEQFKIKDISLIVLGLLYSFIPAFGGLFRVLDIALFENSLLPPNPRAQQYPILISMHIISSSIFSILGTFQLSKMFRYSYPNYHLILGKISTVAVLISTISGLLMTLIFDFPKELQGSVLLSSRIVVSILIIYFLYYSLKSLFIYDFKSHGIYFLRVYFLAIGASTQAVFGLIISLVAEVDLIGIQRDIFMTSAWIFNFLALEVYISRNSLKSKLLLAINFPTRNL